MTHFGTECSSPRSWCHFLSNFRFVLNCYLLREAFPGPLLKDQLHSNSCYFLPHFKTNQYIKNSVYLFLFVLSVSTHKKFKFLSPKIFDLFLYHPKHKYILVKNMNENKTKLLAPKDLDLNLAFSSLPV